MTFSLTEALLFATVFFAPAYLVKFSIGALPTNLLEVLVAACAAMWVVSYGVRKEFPKLPPWWKPAALILGGGVISVFAAPPMLWLKSLGVLKGFLLEPMLVGWIASDVLKKCEVESAKCKVRDGLLQAIILSAAGIALISLLAYAGLWRDVFITWDGRLRGIFLSPNHLAMTLAPAIVLACGFLLHAKEKTLGRMSAVAMVPLSVTLMLTQSLGGIVSTLFALGALLFLALPHLPFPTYSRDPDRSVGATYYHLQKRVVVGMAACTILFAGGFVVSRHVPDLSNPRSSLASRITVWQVSGVILKNHWLWGIGPGNFQEYYLAEQKNSLPYLEWAVPQPHNLFLAFWLQTGLLGLIGFVWLVFGVFSRAFRGFSLSTIPDVQSGPRPERRGYLLPTTKIATALALAAIVLHGLIDAPYWKNDLALTFFVIYSVIQLP